MTGGTVHPYAFHEGLIVITVEISSDVNIASSDVLNDTAISEGTGRVATPVPSSNNMQDICGKS